MRQIIILSESQNHRCCYCGHQMVLNQHRQFIATPLNSATRDHIEPRAYGGTDSDNLVAACLQCNNLRGEMDAIAFYNLLQKWFQRIEGLRDNWHDLSKQTLSELRKLRLESQERQLHGLGVRNIEFAFRHLRLLTFYGHELRA